MPGWYAVDAYHCRIETELYLDRPRTQPPRRQLFFMKAIGSSLPTSPPSREAHNTSRNLYSHSFLAMWRWLLRTMVMQTPESKSFVESIQSGLHP